MCGCFFSDLKLGHYAFGARTSVRAPAPSLNCALVYFRRVHWKFQHTLPGRSFRAERFDVPKCRRKIWLPVFRHSVVCERNLGDGNSIDAACAFGRFDSKFSEYSPNTEVLWPSARQFARLQCIAAIYLQVAMSCDDFARSLPNCFRIVRLFCSPTSSTLWLD